MDHERLIIGEAGASYLLGVVELATMILLALSPWSWSVSAAPARWQCAPKPVGQLSSR
jgi:hypothetical protein